MESPKNDLTSKSVAESTGVLSFLSSKQSKVVIVALGAIAIIAALVVAQVKYGALSAAWVIAAANPITTILIALLAVGAGIYITIRLCQTPGAKQLTDTNKKDEKTDPDTTSSQVDHQQDQSEDQQIPVANQSSQETSAGASTTPQTNSSSAGGSTSTSTSTTATSLTNPPLDNSNPPPPVHNNQAKPEEQKQDTLLPPPITIQSSSLSSASSSGTAETTTKVDAAVETIVEECGAFNKKYPGGPQDYRFMNVGNAHADYDKAMWILTCKVNKKLKELLSKVNDSEQNKLDYKTLNKVYKELLTRKIDDLQWIKKNDPQCKLYPRGAGAFYTNWNELQRRKHSLEDKQKDLKLAEGNEKQIT